MGIYKDFWQNLSHSLSAGLLKILKEKVAVYFGGVRGSNLKMLA